MRFDMVKQFSARDT